MAGSGLVVAQAGDCGLFAGLGMSAAAWLVVAGLPLRVFLRGSASGDGGSVCFGVGGSGFGSVVFAYFAVGLVNGGGRP